MDDAATHRSPSPSYLMGKMDEPAFEAIGDYRFATWKKPPERQKYPRFSLSFFVVVGIAVVVLVGLSRLAIVQMEQGYPFLMRLLAVAMVAFVFGMPFVLCIVLIAARRSPNVEPPLPPSHLPTHAIFVRASVSSGDLQKGAGKGWLWVEGEWLRFEGDTFDFRLRRPDFNTRWDIVKNFRGSPVKLVVPKGISTNFLRLIPCVQIEQNLKNAPKAWDRIEGALRSWEKAPASLEKPLYPPLRVDRAARNPLDLLKPALMAACALGGVTGFTAVVLAENMRANPLVATGLGFLLGLSLYPALLTEGGYIVANRREVDKAIAKARGN